jgi:hypothetical protein
LNAGGPAQQVRSLAVVTGQRGRPLEFGPGLRGTAEPREQVRADRGQQ